MLYGKEEWRPVLRYVKEMEKRSCFPARGVLPYPWENIGPGYCYGPAFGHWDAVHIALDLLDDWLPQAKNQIDNLLALQQADGMFPSIIWMRPQAPSDWAPNQTHPPVWVVAAEKIYEKTGDKEWLGRCAKALERQIAWFEQNRQTADGGFYYTDIKNHLWESGVDEGVRFQAVPQGERACVDATSHLYLLCDCLSRWETILNGSGAAAAAEKLERLGRYIREKLYDAETAFFYDSWAVDDPAFRHLSFEGFWPLIVGAASAQQAEQVIERHMMREKQFLSPHPIATVALCDTLYEKRMWRGPAWNSMTLWAAMGCMRYGQNKAAKLILEKALDATARAFARTGCIWEFYDSLGGSPEQVQRKPHTEFNMPCKDYLGHNPLNYMAELWEGIKDA